MRRLVLLTAASTLVLAAAAPAATKTVSIRDDVFGPRSLTVTKGTTVKWVWRGKSLHDVKVTGGPTRFSSSLRRSGSYSRKLTRTGTYRIVCSIHAPDMRMTVRVK